jgi:hypothetical protein
VENKYWDDGYMRLLKIQGPNSKVQIPRSKFQVLIFRGATRRGATGRQRSKFQIPNSKFQDPNSKVEVPSPNFKRGDKARGDKDPNSKFQIPRSKFENPNSKIQNTLYS